MRARVHLLPLQQSASRTTAIGLKRAQCGTKLPTLALTHPSLLSFNLAFRHLLHLTGLMKQTKHLHRRSPVLGAALGPFTCCNGSTYSTSLLLSGSGRGKASRWSRWGEGNVSPYRVRATFLCVGVLGKSFFIHRLVEQYIVSATSWRRTWELNGWRANRCCTDCR